METEETLIVVAGLAALGLGALYFMYKLMQQNKQVQTVYVPVQPQQEQPDYLTGTNNVIV